MEASKIRYSPAPFYNNKSGRMKANADGTYTVILGGLNTYNSANQWYVLEESDRLFKQSSIFMSNIRERTVYSENGHPVRANYMTNQQWTQRFLGLDEKEFVCIIEEVWLDPNYAKQVSDNRLPSDAVVIMGKVRPTGAKKQVLEEAIANPGQNLCWSIRCISDLLDRGAMKVRIIRSVITFDLVYSGGLKFSKKDLHPSTESLDYDTTKFLKDIDDMGEEKVLEMTSESINTLGIIDEVKTNLELDPSPGIFLDL